MQLLANFLKGPGLLVLHQVESQAHGLQILETFRQSDVVIQHVSLMADHFIDD